MSIFYPYTWAAQFSNESMVRLAKEEWGKCLEKLSDHQIFYGLDVFSQIDNHYPPSMGEFYNCCRLAPSQNEELEKLQKLWTFEERRQNIKKYCDLLKNSTREREQI